MCWWLQSGSQLTITNNPLEAVCGANAIITDTWVGLGQEDEKQRRLADFHGYQVSHMVGLSAVPGVSHMSVCSARCLMVSVCSARCLMVGLSAVPGVSW